MTLFEERHAVANSSTFALLQVIYQCAYHVLQSSKQEKNSWNKPEQWFKSIFHFLGSNTLTLVCLLAKANPHKDLTSSELLV